MNPAQLLLCTLLSSLLLPINTFSVFQNCTSSPSAHQTVEQMKATILRTDATLRRLALQYTKSNRETDKMAIGNTCKEKTRLNSVVEMATVSKLQIDLSHPCGGDEGERTRLLIFDFNQPHNFDRRQLIRRTFGSVVKALEPTVVLYFLVGADEAFDKLLSKESQQYGDILQFSFRENYYNLTLKSVAMLRWSALHCPRVKYILKMDNDGFIRVRKLLHTLETRSEVNSILGWDYKVWVKVLRNADNKWCLDSAVYPPDTYPTYIPGIYFIPGHLTGVLYAQVVSELPALPFDDVYTTGVLAEKAGICRGALPGVANWELDVGKNVVVSASLVSSSLQKYALFFNMETASDIELLWEAFGEEE